MKEIWKDIQGYEELYQVSNLGRVKSLNYRKTGKEKTLRLRNHKTGYVYIGLSKNGETKHYRVHRLVAETFISNPNNYLEVNHKDENPSNNRVDNLEWCTHTYNVYYGARNKRISNKLKNYKRTEEHERKVKENLLKKKKKVVCVTTGKEFNSIKDAAIYYGLKNGTHITNCCKGKRKSAGKHPQTGEKLVWRYL